MAIEIVNGADVRYNDEVVASVERVEQDGQGQPLAILVRQQRADYLLRIPKQFFQVESATRLSLVGISKLDDMEREAITSDRLPPDGTHIKAADDVPPAPAPQQAAGTFAGMPPEYDGPSTG
jgi:hypothetical protein